MIKRENIKKEIVLFACSVSFTGVSVPNISTELELQKDINCAWKTKTNKVTNITAYDKVMLQ